MDSSGWPGRAQRAGHRPGFPERGDRRERGVLWVGAGRDPRLSVAVQVLGRLRQDLTAAIGRQPEPGTENVEVGLEHALGAGIKWPGSYR